MEATVSWRAVFTRERLGFITYDWANSAFVLCVITVIGSKYFVAVFESAAEAAGGLRVGPALAVRVGGIALPAEAAWSFIIAASALLVALSSPVLGALADGAGIKKRFLGAYCAVGVVATLALWFQLPWWAVGALILVANIGFEGGNVFYNAFLPEVAGVREQNLVSSAGFSAGYVGGVLVLIAALFFFIPPKGSINDAFLLVGLWWGAFALVTFALMGERPPRSRAQGNAVGRAFREVGATIKGISRYPQAALFLMAFLLYNDGIVTIISNVTPFALQNIYQDRTLTEKISISQLIQAIIMVQIIGAPATLIFGRVASRFGEKTAIYLTLAVYAGVVAYGQVVQVVSEFFIMAGLIGLVQGGAQAISRSLFASLIPEEKNAEFFGFFALSSKFSGFVGPFLYGALLLLTGDTRLALLTLLVFFVAGGAVLYFVDVERGRREARQG